MVLDGLKDVSPDSINSLDTDDILRLMNFILGPDNKKLYISVIEILGKKQNIMEINTGVSGIDTYKRTCWAVPGSTDNLYLCTSESCPCKAYIDLKIKYPDDEIPWQRILQSIEGNIAKSQWSPVFFILKVIICFPKKPTKSNKCQYLCFFFPFSRQLII